jgi:transcription initiation factor TFIIB
MSIEFIHQTNCKKNMIVTDPATGEIACSNCGTILSEKSLDSGLENSSLIEGYSSSRVGTKISLKMADIGLSTVIESQDKDSTGKPLSKENRNMFYRLRMCDRNSKSANTVKSFQKAFTLLDAIGTKLGLPEVVIEQTAYLFRKIYAKKNS